MRLERASSQAVQYACENYHYAKKAPPTQCAYSVFEEDEWCGVICYGTGNCPHIADIYGLGQGEVIELVRVAFNGKQSHTSKAVAISLKLLKKDCPLVKLVVSYADTAQQHLGTIYQASNWFYHYPTKGSTLIEYKGRKYHSRLFKMKTKKAKELKNALATGKARLIKPEIKHKYLYPLDKKLRPMCEKLSKPCPKRECAGSLKREDTPHSSGEVAVQPRPQRTNTEAPTCQT